MKLNVRAFAASAGILWGAAVFLAAWWLILLEGSGADPVPLSRIYLGFSITPLGSVVGLVWGLVDGAIAGAIFAWLYNTLSGRFGG